MTFRYMNGLLLAGSAALGLTMGVANAKDDMKAMTDQDFVNLAAQSDMTEAHLGQLAQERGSSEAVKSYGQNMVADHTKAYNQLSMVATKANLSVPKGLDPVHDKMIAPLEKLKGAAFDRQYAKMMVSSHETATSSFDWESRNGQNGALKDYAKSTLPLLEKHKNDAEALTKGKS